MKPNEILCNMCGLSCMLDISDEYSVNCGLPDLKVVGGYNSTPGNGDGALDDLTQYEFSLCEWCLDHIFSRCIIPPKCQDLVFGVTQTSSGYFEFKSAATRVRDDDWRKQKEEFFEEFEKRKAARRKSK